MIEVKYPTQRLARPYFFTMLIFFLLQITYGLTIALQQVDPFFLQGILNFNINRATHVNLAVLWVLTGIVGGLLYVGPLIAGRDLARPWLARLLLIAIWGAVLFTATTLPLAQYGIAGWAFGQPWLQEGLEFLEAGRMVDIFLWIGFIILAYLILRIFPRPREWNELHWGLAIGICGLVIFWLFGMFFVPNLDLQEFFRWFVVHYWVEGIWEILYVSLVGFLLYKLFAADLRIIRLMVFWGVVLVVLSGLIGNGHHYFWIGTPALWQFWGSIFSALEPLPIILGVWHVFTHPNRASNPPANRVAFYFIFASSLLEFVGAGLLGFSQTFSLTNIWEHGTWVTPGHAHLALFGTFGMLAIGAAYTALPPILGVRRYDDRISRVAFWLILVGILGMALSFTLGGTVQVYVYRILGLDWFGAVLRPAMQLWRGLLFVFGLLFASGVVTMCYDLFTLKQRALSPDTVSDLSTETHSAWWRKPVTALDMSGWLGGLVLAGFIITGGMLADNLPGVRLGDPTLPYLLAGVGYPALVLLTICFALRFLRACETPPPGLKT